MGLLLFLLFASLLFGTGFILAGLQIAFTIAIFFGLFMGAMILMIILIGLSVTNVFFVTGFVLAALLFGRVTAQRTANEPKQLPPPDRA